MSSLALKLQGTVAGLARMSISGAGQEVSRMMLEPIELTYELHVTPRGRTAFRRWRYELWQGPQLLAAGWRLSALHAQRALRSQAIRHAHRLHGLHALHPDRTPPVEEAPWSGRRVAVESGDLRVMLTPRALLDAAA
jgi:hypothetical protein